MSLKTMTEPEASPMLLKARTESEELLIMRSLNSRMELPNNEKVRLYNLEKGYEGEVKFDEMVAGKLGEERYIINDLLLKVNNSYFQIDSLIISQSGIQSLDIKNYEGDLYIEDEKLVAVKNDREYKNPVIQLKRSATLLRQFLQDLKLDYLVDSSIIFINSEFTLYQAPMDQPFILPTQVSRFISDINKTPSKLDDGHKKLAQQLLAHHQPINPYVQLPEYHYDDLRKGLFCRDCFSFFLSLENNKLVCKKCGGHETIKQGILRGVREYKMLFPNQRITTSDIYEWCGIEVSRRTIRRVLKANFTTNSNNRSTYFI